MAIGKYVIYVNMFDIADESYHFFIVSRALLARTSIIDSFHIY